MKTVQEQRPMPPVRAPAAGLPLGVGRLGRRWWTAALVLAVLAGAGMLMSAAGATAADGAAPNSGPAAVVSVWWGGVGLSLLVIAAALRLSGAARLQPCSRMALLTALAVLLALAATARPAPGVPAEAPLVSVWRWASMVCVAAGALSLYLSGHAEARYFSHWRAPGRWFYRLWAAPVARRRLPRLPRLRSWLAWVMLPSAVAAHTAVGLLFAAESGGPTWRHALQGPAFVAVGGASGLGLLAAVAALVRRLMYLEPAMPARTFRPLGTALFALCLAALYLLVTAALGAPLAAVDPGRGASGTRPAGLPAAHAALFWTGAGTLALVVLLLAVFLMRRRPSVAAVVAAGLAANLAALAIDAATLAPAGFGTLSAAGWRADGGAILALWALSALFFLGAVKLVPILPLAQEAPPRAHDPPASRARPRAAGTVSDSRPHAAALMDP